jgi:sarcosine oxidase gamma subunit
MLAHSSALNIGPGEWLTIAAKGNDDRPRVAPADTVSSTRVIRLKGSDLADFLAGKITRDEALNRIEIKVY